MIKETDYSQKIIIQFFCNDIHPQLEKLLKDLNKKMNVMDCEIYKCSYYNYGKRLVTNMTGYGASDNSDKKLLYKIVKSKTVWIVREYMKLMEICKCGKNLDDIKTILESHLETAVSDWNYRKENLCRICIDIVNTPF